MARAAFACTLGQALSDGRFVTQSGPVAPTLTPATTADDAVATAQALEAAITDAQAAAEVNGVIAADGTALALVQAIGTATAAYVAAIVTAKTATAAALTAADDKDAVLDIDLAVLTSPNAIRATMRSMLRLLDASGL